MLADEALDPGIEHAVVLLRQAQIATVESCEGGLGHCFPEPTVRFEGSRAEAWRALAVALDHNLPVLYLRRQWTISDGDPEGPYWELVFRAENTPRTRLEQPGADRSDRVQREHQRGPDLF